MAHRDMLYRKKITFTNAMVNNFTNTLSRIPSGLPEMPDHFVSYLSQEGVDDKFVITYQPKGRELCSQDLQN